MRTTSASSVSSVSVDLDPLGCYYQIHGLASFPTPLSDVVLLRGLPRFLEMFDRYRLPATFFVVGRDATGDRVGRPLLKQAAKLGHELGNHSFSHPYNLSRLAGPLIEQELVACEQVLQQLRPEGSPKGFRAPGYELSDALLGVLRKLDFQYDSSIFPCPAYYALKLAVLGGLWLRGRSSASVVGSLGAQFSSTQPYFLKPTETVGTDSLVELPVAVTKTLRLPVIGTFLLLSKALRKTLLCGMRGQPFFNLEFHGIDLLDAKMDGIPDALVARQPDLRIPLWQKQAAMAEILSALQNETEVCTLGEFSQRFRNRAG